MNRELALLVSIPLVCLAIGALIFWFRRQKFVDAHNAHLKKTDLGFVLVDVKLEGWSDGCDVVLYYSDGTTHVIQDTRTIPSWAVQGSKR